MTLAPAFPTDPHPPSLALTNPNQAEMEGLQLNTDPPDGSSPYLSQDLSSDVYPYLPTFAPALALAPTLALAVGLSRAIEP